MHYAVIFLLLLIFVFGLGLLARRLAVPYPILFVIGGLLISFIPDLPQLKVDPDFVFFIFLPPLLYIQAFYTSWRDFRRELRAISLLAVGLVFVTIVTVAYVSHWLIPGFPLSSGFVLGAIVSPPDAIAASAIAQNLGLPRRVVTVLEGESLVNDATGLVAFNMAVRVAATAVPVIGGAWVPGTFIYVAVGGVVVGLVVGWFVNWIRKRIINDGPEIVLTVSLVTPFASYLVAEPLQVSSVLAVVTTGLYLGWESPYLMPPTIRLQAQAVWTMIVYLLNGIIFVLIGLQLPGILHRIVVYSWPQLITYALVVNATCILVRLAWVYPGAYLPFLFPSVRKTEVFPDWRQVFIVGWAGMRGVVSLAAALALDGYPGITRVHLVQFLAFSVILTTLVFQGLTLPPLIRYFGLSDDGSADREELEARTRMSEAVLEKIARLRREEKFPIPVIDNIEQFYRERDLALKDDLADQLGWSDKRQYLVNLRRMRRAMIATQRRTLIDMRRSGLIGDDVMHKIEHELDLEDVRLKI